MKNLLNYQSSEYDCGPVTLTNAIRYLFEREEIPPDIIKNIMLYCLDSCNEAGEVGKHGTSASAMMFLGSWLNQFGAIRKFPISCEFLSGESVSISQNSRIVGAIQQGGAVVVRLFLEVDHYVLLTGVEGEDVLLFDPYYEELDDVNLDAEYSLEGISFITDQPKRANRRVSMKRMNSHGKDFYEMGPDDHREALIIFNKEKKAAPEETVEYII
ncbi:MAG: peptidase C39 [Lachnospiraceae bacterium]|nr:peptidase C39 [Lachnospiraceae bacterium]